MGLFSFVGSCIKAVGSAFVGVCRAASIIAGPVLGPLTKPILDIAIKVGKVVFEGIVKIVSDVAKVLGLVPEKTEPEELGERQRQHPEIKPEDYDSTRVYVQALQDAKLDEAKFEEAKQDEAQMMLDKAAGLGIEQKLLEEKFKMTIPLDFFTAATVGKMSKEDVRGLLEALHGGGIRDAGVFADYLAGTDLSPATRGKLDGALAGYEKVGGTPVSTIEENVANFKAQPAVEA